MRKGRTQEKIMQFIRQEFYFRFTCVFVYVCVPHIILLSFFFVLYLKRQLTPIFQLCAKCDQTQKEWDETRYKVVKYKMWEGREKKTRKETKEEKLNKWRLLLRNTHTQPGIHIDRNVETCNLK